MFGAGHFLTLKGVRPLPPTPADSRIFGFLDFSENVDFWNFPVGFGVWEGLKSMGNAFELQWMDSQLISIHVIPFPSMFMISVILLSFPLV